MAVFPILLTAVITFIATNIDDIFVLMLFFSQTDNSFRRRHVIVGQYLGFIALVAVSLLGFLGSFIIPKELIGLLGVVPIGIGIRKFQRAENEIESANAVPPLQKTPSQVARFLHPKTYGVAVVTFANGGDNIGIYTPLFANMELPSLIVTVITFLVLVMAWCLLSIRLTHQKQIAQLLSRYGQIMVPLVLIGLGIYIFIENGAHHLLGL